MPVEKIREKRPICIENEMLGDEGGGSREARRRAAHARRYPAAYRPAIYARRRARSSNSVGPLFRARPGSRGIAKRPIKETREPALSRRAYIVLTKKSASDRGDGAR